jgi:hypothetical protein
MHKINSQSVLLSRPEDIKDYSGSFAYIKQHLSNLFEVDFFD